MADPELSWMALRGALASPEAAMYEEQASSFAPVGDAVKAMVAAAQSEDPMDFGFASHFGGLNEQILQEMYLASLGSAFGQLDDPKARERLYQAAKGYQTSSLGDIGGMTDPGNRAMMQHALNSMVARAQALGANKAPVVPMQGQAAPGGYEGEGLLSELEQQRRAKEEAARELGLY